MNTAHLHLLVNHFPIITPLLAGLILFFAILMKSENSKRIAYFLFIVAGLATMAAMATGDGAEDAVESIAGVTESSIEEHEESAEVFAVLNYVLAVLSIIGLWASLKQKKFSALLSIAIVLLTVVSFFFAYQTGNSGGKIRHTELNSAVENTAGIKSSQQLEEHDDD